MLCILLYLASAVAYFLYLVQQKGYQHRLGLYLLGAGFFCHSVYIGYEFARSGHLPVYTLRETLVLVGWTIAGVFLIFQHRLNLRVLGVYAAPLETAVMVIAYNLPPDTSLIQKEYSNLWMIAHVVVIFLGEALFALACGVGILYLLQERAIKRKQPGFFFKRLPSLQQLDRTGYACVVVGFSLLTLGLITGFLYAKSAWGRLWDWDPKEVWSGVTWLFYAALLHERLVAGWQGRRAAIMAIIGFAVLLFTFFGVNFLLEGHHGAFTQW